MSRPDLVLVTIAGQEHYGVVGDHPDQKKSPGRKVVHLFDYPADPPYVLIEENTPLRRPAVVDPHDAYDLELLLKVLPAGWELLEPPEELVASRQELFDSLLLYIEHQRDAEPAIYAIVEATCVHQPDYIKWVRDHVGWWPLSSVISVPGDNCLGKVHSWTELTQVKVLREGVESDGE